MITTTDHNEVSANIYTDSEPAKGAAVKITLPESVSNDLAAFAEAKGVTKSEIVKSSLQMMLNSDPTWQRRAFFFKRREQTTDQKTRLAQLAEARKGSLVSVAVSNLDNPNNAILCICNLVKISGTTVFIEFPNVPPVVTSLHNSLYTDQRQVALSNGKLVIPTETSLPLFNNWPQLQYIYAVGIENIWDVDLDPPQNTFGINSNI